MKYWKPVVLGISVLILIVCLGTFLVDAVGKESFLAYSAWIVGALLAVLFYRLFMRTYYRR